MGINFPSTPTEGQTLRVGKVDYVYKSGAWRPAALKTAMPFNYFVNGSLQVSQEIGNASLLAGSGYPADCWLWAPNPGNIMTVSRVPVRSGDGSQFRLRLVCTTLKTSYVGAEYMFFLNRIEGNRVADFQWGTPNAKPAVLRLKVNAPNGGYGFSLRNIANNRSYSGLLFVNVESHLKDTEFVFAIPGDTTGTWDKGTGTGIDICFTLACGTTYGNNNPNRWVDGNFITTGGMSPAATSTLGRTFEFSDFGFYLDPDGTGRAPPFELVPEGQAMFDSQRFFQRCLGAVGVAISNVVTHQRATYPNQASMRAAPAAALVGAMRAWDQATAPAITSFYAHYSNRDYFEYNFNSVAQTLGRGAMLLDTNGTSIFISQSARL